MTYSISSYGVCTQGDERLRNRNEFILATPIFHFASVGAAESIKDIREALNEDLQCCERPEHFDYNAARAVIDSLCDETLAPLYARNANPFGLEERDEQSDDCEPCYLFVYVADDSHEYSVWGN